VFRALFAVLALFSLAFPAQQRRPAPPPPPEPDEEEAAEPEYTFNPIQALKEMKVGDFYFKKGSYRAAAGRYERAVKWQPDLAEAYYKLGESREKLDQPEAAIDAYQKYLEAAPDARRADAVKKRIARLQKKAAQPDERSPRAAGPGSQPPVPGR
jgi:tetratricopeptide (TPR) repeat protein